MRAGLAPLPFLVALLCHLGEQGARLGAWVVPPLSLWWVAAAVALAFLLTPRTASIPGRVLSLEASILAVGFIALLSWRHETLHPEVELSAVVDGERAVRMTMLNLEERRELRRLTGARRNVELETAALLSVPRSGRYRFELYCDDLCEIALGENELRVEGARSEEIELEEGELPFALRYRQEGGPAAMLLAWNRPGAIELLPMAYYLRSPRAPPRGRFGAHLALAALLVWWAAFSRFVVRLGRSRGALERRRTLPAAALCLLVLYGGLVRFEAFLAHASLASAESIWARTHETLLPFMPPYAVFNPEIAPDDPYRADVRSYLDRAGELTIRSFYEPSFREPFYVALTKPFLSAAGGEIGILVQSFVFSVATLALFALVAWRLHGPRWSVALLVPVALHEWLVLEAPTGYRMSAYGFFLVGTAVFPFLARARPRSALAGGGIAGLTCLIRLSALSAVVPLAALRVALAERSERLLYGALYAGAAVAIVAPFLWSNYSAHGDPLYSVSFHTEFWLRAEGLREDASGPVSLTRYFTDFDRSWDVAKGTALGMTVLPLRTFWNGLRHFALLDAAVLVLGMAGLLTAVRSRPFLPLAYFGHLVPFAYIQNFPSGEMPRFVMPAFFFLVLAIPEGWASMLTLARRVANLKLVRTVELLVIAVLACALARPALSQDDELPKKYKDWLEKEVVYIISDREKEAFEELRSAEEWDAFIEAFWRKRDPEPLTPENEFKIEHYRRIEFANQRLGGESAVPGWMTDRGKMYIILGEPDDREEFTSVPNLYPTELWFYRQNREKSLPPLYLLFFQEFHAGPYRLFNHLLDEPQDLMPARQFDVVEGRALAFEMLQEVNPGLAHATITMRADQGVAAGIMQPDRQALDFQALLSDIYVSPFRRVDTSYVDVADEARGLVESEYLFNYVPSTGVAHVLPGPGGSSFVHYAIEIEPQNMTMAHDPDEGAYYTSFEMRGEVTTADGSTVVLSFDKEPYVRLTPSQFREVGARAFAYRDSFPIVPGEFQFRLVLKNRARSEYTIFESALEVPERPEDAVYLGEPVLLHGMARFEKDDADAPEIAPYRTYQLGNVGLEPNAKRTVAIGNYLMAHVPIEGDSPGSELVSRVEPLDPSSSGAAPPIERTHRLDLYERPVVLRMPLEDLPGGRYALYLSLREPGGAVVATSSTAFNVSPRAEIPRPWALRDSIEGEKLDLVRVSLAEQSMRLERETEARALAEAALGDDVNSVPARLLLARMHLDEGGHLEAVRLLEPARAQAPEHVEVLLALADAHFQLGNFSRAAELFESATEIRRPDPAVLNALGICHARLGSRERAIGYLKRSLELDPEQEPVRALLAELEASPSP